MSSKMIRTLVFSALLSTGLPVAASATPADPIIVTATAPEVRVVNNHTERIRVVVVNQEGRHHSLGTVSPKKAGIFGLEGLADEGTPLQVKVIVDAPAWSAGNTGETVRTEGLMLREGSAVQVWVEPTLTSTSVEIYN